MCVYVCACVCHGVSSNVYMQVVFACTGMMLILMCVCVWVHVCSAELHRQVQHQVNCSRREASYSREQETSQTTTHRVVPALCGPLVCVCVCMCVYVCVCVCVLFV